MEIYQLTNKGEMLAHNMYAPNNTAWRVVFCLSKRGQATKEQIISDVPSATGHTLYNLRRKNIIQRVGRMAEV